MLTLRVNHLVEVKRWALSWGTECEVLGPEELRKGLKREVSEIGEKYRKT